MKYLLIGGAGYVGSRLARRLSANPENHVDVLDLGLLWPDGEPAPWKWEDVRKVHPVRSMAYHCVIWLATIHDMPPEEEKRWKAVTRELMVELPLLWSWYPARFVYFSSMRAETHPHTLYGRRKREFETRASPKTLIIRPGTVWGGYDPRLPNRNHTALNRMILEPNAKLAVPQYHVFIENLLDLVEARLGNNESGIVEAYDPEPWHKPELGRHPMELYRRYYRIGVKKQSAEPDVDGI